MKIIGYEKRKNKELFKSFKNLKTLEIKEIQNYIPIYNKFFNFDKTQEINLDHCNFISDIEDNESMDENDEFPEKIFNVEIKNKNGTFKKKSFLKLTPVVEASQFLTGKYKLNNEDFYKLPNIEQDGHVDLYDTNNISYTDSLFSFLSSKLLNTYHFENAIDYYGSFLSIIDNFRLDISDDAEYYNDSDFFVKNKNKLFRIENDTTNPTLSFEDTDEILKFDCFEPSETHINFPVDSPVDSPIHSPVDSPVDSPIHSPIHSPVEVSPVNSEVSESSCSSRSSYTERTDNSYMEEVNVIFNKYLVQITSLEHCVDTLDTLILSNSLKSEDEWLSCLFQIIITLILFQDVFSFTHNDLHTNNIMYVRTEKEFLSYCYRGIYYKIPTFGRIFKIIDFGRSIYKVNGQICCSNSFRPSGDASTQYNCEPYFNDKKKRVDPNFSFDLCRLACSIWDNIDDSTEKTGVVKIIDDWCKDDKGKNVLYKQNGEERYPNFKLYKMIARTVHNHTPHNQLQRPEFSKFITTPIDAIMLDDIPKF
jgi:hypothetical protein